MAPGADKTKKVTSATTTGGRKQEKKNSSASASARPITPYIAFCKMMRPKLLEKYPNASFGELGRMLGEAWNKMSSSEKMAYGQGPEKTSIVETAVKTA